MGSVNLRAVGTTTHEGGASIPLTKEQQLRRAVMCCMLWENQFYESGQSIADRITQLASVVPVFTVQQIARDAKHKFKLRHVPLLLLTILSERKAAPKELIADLITRIDDLTELLSLYWLKGKKPIPAQMKKGLALAFAKFDEYQLAKYNRAKAVKLRDVIRLAHPKPKDEAQKDLWKRLIAGELKTPYTWETELSAGKEKKEVFTALLSENKLGALAFLRNLRNMLEAGVDIGLMRSALAKSKKDRILPYQFIAAAKYAPALEPDIESSMLECLAGKDRLSGNTILLVDVSGSMDDKISAKSELTRLDAACGLAIILREQCESCRVITFSSTAVEVPPRRGFALKDAINQSQPHGGTALGGAIDLINKTTEYDRIIVITDEQARDSVNAPQGIGYMVNVASYQHAVGFGPWLRVDGWSEAIVDFITESEKAD